MSLLKHRIETLRLRHDAPFPSDLREMVNAYKKEKEHAPRRHGFNPDDPDPRRGNVFSFGRRQR